MVEGKPKTQYFPSIGIECHVQLKTKTKLFAAVSNDAREAEPNTLISHICVGMPGALPVLNEAAVKLAVLTAFILNTEPEKFSKFDRKHYFYPDLPKGYQITQYEEPIITGGNVELEVAGQKRNIRIARVNLEEDAGKTIHPGGADYSLVDLNRAGTPLLEIVSEPDIHSAQEAKAYARELYLLMKYGSITEGDLYHGNVRFDVNISLSDNRNGLGTRSEIKNLNSFRSVEATVEHEIKRQTELLQKGQKIIQETRGWDEAKQKTTAQREKEEAHDYRYMPEPDLPPLELEPSFIKKIKESMGETLEETRRKLKVLKISSEVIEEIIDQPEVLKRILSAIGQTSAENARKVAFQLLEKPQTLKINIKDQIKVAEMLTAGELSSSASKTVLKEVLNSTEAPEKIAKRLNLLQLSGETEIEQIVAQVISANPGACEDIKKGEVKAVSFLVGQVMKESKGRANPGVAERIIRNQLGVS